MATQRTDSADELPGELADAFGRAGKSVMRAFDERLGEHGVSTPRSKVLAEIQRLGPVRLADLARAVGITQGTASTLVDALVRDQLVVRSTDADDRRARGGQDQETCQGESKPFSDHQNVPHASMPAEFQPSRGSTRSASPLVTDPACDGVVSQRNRLVATRAPPAANPTVAMVALESAALRSTTAPAWSGHAV